MKSKSPRVLPPTTKADFKQLAADIAAVQKQADAAKQEAQAAKAAAKEARKKYKSAKRAAKKLKKIVKALKADFELLSKGTPGFGKKVSPSNTRAKKTGTPAAESPAETPLSAAAAGEPASSASPSN